MDVRKPSTWLAAAFVILILGLARPALAAGAQAIWNAAPGQAGQTGSLGQDPGLPPPPSYAQTPTADLSASQAITSTETVTPTVAVTVTLTPTAATEPTPAPTAAPRLTGTRSIYLPGMQKVFPVPAVQKARLCTNPAAAIPDGSAQGVKSNIFAPQDGRVVLDMDITLDVQHSWVGDLVLTLSHADSGRAVTLIDRPGLPGREKGCRLDNVFTKLDDDSPLPVDTACDYVGSYSDDLNPPGYNPSNMSGISFVPTINSVLKPEQPLKIFRGDRFGGTWTLTASDQSAFDTGKVRNWCIDVTLGYPRQVPKDTPPPNLPTRALIPIVRSVMQAMPLDCESRVAVDFAYFFGYNISEAGFFYNLPTSDDPDKGFVGNVWGSWGQTPPNAYGVHAKPVANLLRRYGVPAVAHQPLSWTALKQEIAAGRPVFVWIIGPVKPNGTPSLYWAYDRQATIVANYEHVALVTGYDEDSDTVTVRDNGYTRYPSYGDFLRSWGAIGNQAITFDPTQKAAVAAEAEAEPSLSASARATEPQFEIPPGVQFPIFGQGGWYYGPGNVLPFPEEP